MTRCSFSYRWKGQFILGNTNIFSFMCKINVNSFLVSFYHTATLTSLWSAWMWGYLTTLIWWGEPTRKQWTEGIFKNEMFLLNIFKVTINIVSLIMTFWQIWVILFFKKGMFLRYCFSASCLNWPLKYPKQFISVVLHWHTHTMEMHQVEKWKWRIQIRI